MTTETCCLSYLLSDGQLSEGLDGSLLNTWASSGLCHTLQQGRLQSRVGSFHSLSHVANDLDNENKHFYSV